MSELICRACARPPEPHRPAARVPGGGGRGADLGRRRRAGRRHAVGALARAWPSWSGGSGVPLFEREGRRRVLAPTRPRRCSTTPSAVLARTQDLARWADRRRAGDDRRRAGRHDRRRRRRTTAPRSCAASGRERPDVDLRLTVAPSDAAARPTSRAARARPRGVRRAAGPRRRRSSGRRCAATTLAVYAPPHADVGPPPTWGPWVTFPARSHTRAVITAALRALGAPFDVVAESHQPEVLREMVRSAWAGRCSRSSRRAG